MMPERLSVFAVLAPDGTIIEGRSSFDAMLRACEAGYDHLFDNAGFITSHGRFVPEGREALMLAFRAGQLRKNTSLYKSLAQGVIPLWDFRTHGNESSVRGVGGKNVTVAPPPEPIICARIDWRGITHRPETNPERAVYLQDVARKAGYPPDYNNPAGPPLIVSCALRFQGENGEEVAAIDHFSKSGYVDSSGRPWRATEGYTLSDGSFLTRAEAGERFADSDIGWEREDNSQSLPPSRPA